MPRIFVKLLVLGTVCMSLGAQTSPIVVPNHSFEMIDTTFADPRVDSWQKTPKPEWYTGTGESAWENLTGVFQNTAPEDPAYIPNMDGDQGLFLFAVPTVGVFQDYDSVDFDDAEPSLQFDASFEPGKSYQLTFGAIGGGGGMQEGTTMLASVYYRDEEGNIVPVASTTVTHDLDTFPNTTDLVDFVVDVPVVQTGDAWAGKNLGIQLLSTVVPDLAGGYWDLDNVRLTSKVEFIPVPNHSFESPDTVFADPRIDSWQKTPKPEWYTGTGEADWFNLTGVFENTAEGSPDRKANMDGNQGLFLFAVPTVGIFQDYESLDYDDAAPSHHFDAAFEADISYKLSVGVIGGGGGMLEGASLMLMVYYRDDSGNMVPVSSTAVVHSAETFPDQNHFVDFHVDVPAMEPGHPAIGRKIGIQILSTASPDLAGGYWDLDNVRLVPTSGSDISFAISQSIVDGQLRISWPSVVGYDYQVRSSTGLSEWDNEGSAMTGTGSILSIEVPLSGGYRFFTVVADPENND